MSSQGVYSTHEQHHCPRLADEEIHDCLVPSVKMFVRIGDVVLEPVLIAFELVLSCVGAIKKQPGRLDYDHTVTYEVR
jgi:hypothetical protein